MLLTRSMKTELSTPAIWNEQLAPYRHWLKAAGRPETTIYLRLYHLRRFAVESNLTPFEVTLDDLLEHLANENWGASARRAVRSSLRKFYGWAHVTGRMQHDPSGLLPTIPVPPGRRRQPATTEAVSAGMQHDDPRVRLMTELGDRGGMRCCEIAAVHAVDVHLDEQGRSKLLVHGKGNRLRTIDISDSFALRLLDHAQGGYLFPGKINGHLSAGYVSKLLSRAMPGSSTGHGLRHKAGTRVLRTSGGNLRVVQEFLGHASVATTEIYTHVESDELREAVLAA